MKSYRCAYFIGLFLHGILGVNASNFRYKTYATKFIKYTPYNPRIINKVCFLKPDRGPCRGNIDMAFFDPSSRNCSTFKWGGCQGNGNRFNSLSECTEFCLEPPNAEKSRPKYCSHSFDYGFCFGALNRYYFDSKWKICKKAIYSGCGGNRNNFESLSACEQECRIGKFRTRATTISNKLKKFVVINAVHATTQKSRIQITTKKNLTLKS